MLEGSFAVFVVFYFFYNLYSVYKVGVKAYVSSVLNLIDLASSGLFFTTIAFHAMYLINMRHMVLIAEDEYKDFQIAAFLYPSHICAGTRPDTAASAPWAGLTPASFAH